MVGAHPRRGSLERFALGSRQRSQRRLQHRRRQFQFTHFGGVDAVEAPRTGQHGFVAAFAHVGENRFDRLLDSLVGTAVERQQGIEGLREVAG